MNLPSLLIVPSKSLTPRVDGADEVVVALHALAMQLCQYNKGHQCRIEVERAPRLYLESQFFPRASGGPRRLSGVVILQAAALPDSLVGIDIDELLLKVRADIERREK